jgi:hypothetical protein
VIFILFLAFAANLILRLNDYIPGFAGFPVAEVLIPALVGLWLLFERKDFSLATDLLIPAFFFIIVAGYALKVHPGGTWTVARGFIPWVALYFLTANLVKNRARMDWLLGVLFVCGVVLVLHSAQQISNYDGLSDETGTGWSGETLLQGRARYVGVMNDPNDLALFFAMMLPVALQLAGKGMGAWRECAGYVLCLPLLYGIFLCNSRGGMLAAGAVFFLHSLRRFGAFKAVSVCVVLAALVLAAGPSRLRESNEMDAASSQGRIEAWYEGFLFFKSSPLVGIGKDQFTEHHILTAHNSFVLCFAETGFLGYLAWFGASYHALFGLHHVLLRTRPGTRSSRQGLAVFNALAAFFTGGFFLSRTYFILLPVFLGLAVAQFKAARDDLEAQSESQNTAATGEDSARLPVILDDDTDAEAATDLIPHAPPLPNLTWPAMPATMPSIAGLAVFSMAVIYLIVKVRL